MIGEFHEPDREGNMAEQENLEVFTLGPYERGYTFLKRILKACIDKGDNEPPTVIINTGKIYLKYTFQ